MTTRPPTTHEIAELAEQRTTRFFGPKDPPTGGSAENWTRERERVYEQQTAAARSELNRKYEKERDREAAQEAAVKAQVDEREAEMRRRFDRRFPGGLDADFAAMRPTLMAELSSDAEREDAAARETMRRRLRSIF